MKKFAIIAASLICFAGCARNDTDYGTADSRATDTSTAAGSAATSQSGRDTATNNISTPSALTNSQSSILSDTNALTPMPPQPLPPAVDTPPSIQSDRSSGQLNNPSQSNSDASAGQQQNNNPPRQSPQ